MSCPHCQFSWERIVEMKENQEEFRTGGGRIPQFICDLDINNKTFTFLTHIGRATRPIEYKTVKEVHDLVHSGSLELVPSDIDYHCPKTFRWGNRIVGLLKHLGCKKIEEEEAMTCPHPQCKFGWEKLEEMMEEGEEFRTAKKKKPLWIADVDRKRGKIRMRRSTNRFTNWLNYSDIEEIHDLVHSGGIELLPQDISNYSGRLRRWGNYMTGLLNHLGCRRIDE